MIINMWSERVCRFWQNIRRAYVPGYKYLPGGYAFFPIDITLELTYACNLRCPMCYQKVVQDQPENNEKQTQPPSLDNYRRFLHQISRSRPNIRMTGGEPMLYPYYFELTGFARKLGLNVITPTNGTLLASNVEKIVSLPVNLLIITITGPEDVHDKQVGVTGAFEAAKEGIETVLKARRTSNSAFPKVFINAVWSKENQDCMPDMIHFANALGVDAISFTHVWYWDEHLINRQDRQYPQFGSLHCTPESAFREIDPDKLIKSIRKMRAIPSSVPVLFYPDLTESQIIQYYTSSSVPVTDHVCKVPWLATYIRPNGDVAPCYLNYAVGNIRDSDFRQIWQSTGYRALRKELKRSGPLPACHRCTGSFLFSTGRGNTFTLG